MSKHTLVETIDSTQWFTLAVVEIPDVPQGNVYAVINNKFGVIEMSTSLITNAYEFFDELNKWATEKFGGKAVLPDLSGPPTGLAS